MSYLRGLVRKTRAPRPQIAPRAAAPAAQPQLDLAFEVHEEVVAARRPAATAPAAPASPREAAIARRSDSGASERARASTDPAPHDDVPSAARGRAPDARAAGEPAAPPEAPAAAQLVISRRTRMVRRRVPDPAPSAAERGSESASADLDGHPIVPVRTRQQIAREPSPRRHARLPAAVLPPHDRDQSRPDVHISIGRLEVRATAATPVKPERPAPFRPSLTLQDYLAGRSRGQ